MASSQFFDPTSLLRTTPLLLATLTLSHTLDTSLHLSPLNTPHLRQSSNPLLPTYFSSISTSSFYRHLATIPLTIATATANLYYVPQTQATRWFKIGVGMTLAHFVFTPFMAAAKQAIMTNHVARNANVALDEWLWYNKVRGLTVDLAAWVVLGVAAMKSLGK